MKKALRFVAVCMIICALSIFFLACDADSFPEELVGYIPDTIKNLHEHSWNNWEIKYSPSDVALVCELCNVNIQNRFFPKGSKSKTAFCTALEPAKIPILLFLTVSPK